MKSKRKTAIGAHLVLALASIGVLVPFGYAISISLSGKGLADYLYILQKSSFPRNFVNSATITGISLAAILAVSLLGAYAFSKLRMPLRRPLYLAVLCMMMFPVAVILVPLFQINFKLHLINSFLAVIGPYVALFAPFNLLTAKNFYDGVPDELMEAARIDGCGSMRTFLSIMLPLSGPIVIVVIVWGFITVWNEYLLALVFLQAPQVQTLTVLPSQFLQAYQGDIPKMFAALVIMMLPVLVIYLVLQRYIAQGLTAGAVKD
jgi:ABC-type sugar transport system, permease component